MHDNTQTEAKAHAPLPYSLFIQVWVALVLLTCVTVGATLTWPGRVGTAVAMAVTPVKASLVLLFFMHLRYEPVVFRVMFLSAVTVLAVFMGLTFFDYLFR